jgi:O-methyltransferase
MIDAMIQRVASSALCRVETLRNTAELCQLAITEGIPGDVVECGVYRGAHPAVMAAVLMDAGTEMRRVWLFDSFEGVPESGPLDDWPGIPYDEPGRAQRAKLGRLVPTGVAGCPIERVHANMRLWGILPGLLEWRPGWFQETMTGDLPEKIALLRLDGDLYESTKVCLQALYPRLSSGGWCIVDDFALPGCRAACDECVTEMSDFAVIDAIQGAVCWRKA